MWEMIALALAGLALVLLGWLIVLLIRLKKIRFRFRALEKAEREKIRGIRSLKIEELRERVQFLEAVGRYFFEEGQTCNVRLDREGRIRDISKSFLNIFDREKSELINLPLVDLVVPAERESFSGYLREHQKDQYTPVREVEFSAPRGNHWILFGEKHLTVAEDHIPIGIVLSGIDVTERRRVKADEEELKRKLALSARMEELGIMAGGIAHDLKNLFNPVLSYPDLIAERLPPESDLKGPVKRIKKAAAQASELVQNFLSLARRGRLELAPLDLNEVATVYSQSMGCKTLQDRFPRARLKIELAEGLPPVMGLAPQLNSVLMNLVKNGCEAMEEGGEIRVSTYARRLTAPYRGLQQIPRGDYAVLKVEDSGKGMSSEEVRRLFTPFASGKDMGTSGTGLGMVVVAGVIEDHRGYIDVKSEPGRGTSIMIYLRALEVKPEGQARLPGNGERILVIDDSADDRRDLTRQLTSLGYEVVGAADGEEALRYLRHQSADLLVIDLMLDNENGVELYRRIQEVIPGIRCVLISGGLDHQARENAFALGITGCLDKPATEADLARVVRAELDKTNPDAED